MEKNHSAYSVCNTLLTDRRMELEQAIRQLGTAAGVGELDEKSIQCFFENMLDNFWDAYEEATCKKGPELKQINEQILDIENHIRKLIGSENCALMEQYSVLVNSRDQHELEGAFLVGYQCALRFVLMGVMPVTQLMQGYWCRERKEN